MTRGFETIACSSCGAVTSACYAQVTGGLCFSCRQEQREYEREEAPQAAPQPSQE